MIFAHTKTCTRVVLVVVILVPVAIGETTFAHHIAVTCAELLDVGSGARMRLIHTDDELHFVAYVGCLKEGLTRAATAKHGIALLNLGTTRVVDADYLCKHVLVDSPVLV